MEKNISDWCKIETPRSVTSNQKLHGLEKRLENRCVRYGGFAILFPCFVAAQANSDRCGERHKVSKLR